MPVDALSHLDGLADHLANASRVGLAPLALALDDRGNAAGVPLLRRAPRFKDGNHAALRTLWRSIGASWLDIIPIEGGEPDALIGWRGQDRLIEVKNPEGGPSARRARASQVEWHRAWKGRPVAVVLCFDDMLRLFEPSGRATRL